jgi:hypothetical protein
MQVIKPMLYVKFKIINVLLYGQLTLSLKLTRLQKGTRVLCAQRRRLHLALCSVNLQSHCHSAKTTVLFISWRTCYLATHYVHVTPVRYNLKMSHGRHISDSWLTYNMVCRLYRLCSWPISVPNFTCLHPKTLIPSKPKFKKNNFLTSAMFLFYIT